MEQWAGLPYPSSVQEHPYLKRSQQVAMELRRRVQAGIWHGVLPGVRVLAAELAVDFKTVMAALEDLERDGVIGKPRGTRPRKILDGRGRDDAAAPATVPPDACLLILTPHDEGDDTATRELLAGMQEAWSSRFGKVRRRAVDFGRWKSTDHILGRFIERAAADAVVLFNAPAPWCASAMALRPNYLSGGDPPESAGQYGLSMFACGIGREYDRIFRELRGMGHKRILLPMARSGRGLRAFLRDHLLPLWERGQLLGSPDDYVVEVTGDDPAAWSRMWAREFTRLRPTAVIVPEPTQMISLYSHCHTAGLRIPRHLSVASLGDSAELGWLTPPPYRMRFPVRKALKHFQLWIDGGLKPVGSQSVSLLPVEGRTLAPPPKGS